MTETKQPDEPQTIRGESGKRQADFFAAVRSRGMLNAMLDLPEQEFLTANSGMKTRWEFFPPNGDTALVEGREAYGFRLVDASELPSTSSSQKSGIIRRGDLVLMAAPAELVDMLAEQDAKAAEDDFRAPVRAYEDNLNRSKVRLSSGEEGQAVPLIEKVTKRIETVRPVANEEVS